MKQWTMLALALVTGAAQADEAAVRAAVQRLLPNAVIESVQPAAMADVFEVVANGEVLYVGADGQHLLQGRLYDAQRRADLTASTENGLRRAALAKVGEEKRIRFAAAEEKHRITIFTDVDCGYCRKLHKEMSAINAAGITVDYLMFPRAGQPSASYDKAGYVWCAVDRQDALTASMSAGSCRPTSARHARIRSPKPCSSGRSSPGSVRRRSSPATARCSVAISIRCNWRSA
ncbi:MAG: thioredoxin fold domain-containing protein [Xanthomonadales bacterium]|nr:thioredoxin fold domain-containing protein [Xanthomonadales bacterium]